MNNEEKILEMLEKLSKTQGKHSEMLESLTEKVDTLNGTVEQHGEILARHSETLSELQKTVTRVAVTQENIVIPQIKLLAEGHDVLLNTLARKDRVEALEDDVALLKTVVKAMSQRLSELEKAQ